MVAALANVSTTLYRPLAISFTVLSGQYADIPTFGQLGLEIDSYGMVYGIAVSSETPVKLCQEIANAFSNVSVDPSKFVGSSVLSGYTYGSQTMNNYINHVYTNIFGSLPVSPQSSNHKTNTTTLRITLGVIIPLFVILVLIIVIALIYLKRKKSRLELFEIPLNIGNRTSLDSTIVDWNSITDLTGIGSGA